MENMLSTILFIFLIWLYLAVENVVWYNIVKKRNNLFAPEVENFCQVDGKFMKYCGKANSTSDI